MHYKCSYHFVDFLEWMFSISCMPLGKFLETWNDFLKIIFTFKMLGLGGAVCWAPYSVILEILKKFVFKVEATWEKSLLCTFNFYSISLLLRCCQRFPTALIPHYLFWEIVFLESGLCTFPPYLSAIVHISKHLNFIQVGSLIFCIYLYILVFVYASLSFCSKWPNLSFMAYSRYSLTVRAKKVSHSQEQQGHIY